MSFLKKLLDAISPPDKANPLPPKEEKNKTKGDMFEKYVENLFDKKYYVTEEWTSDIYNKRNGSYVESNKNPDLTIRHIPSGDRFAVECKYRSQITNSKTFNTTCIQWSHPDQIQRYNAFQSSKHIPVFIVIGVGNDIIKNKPPKLMFCIPLNKAKYPEIFTSVLEQFERNPEKKFFWKDGILK